MKTIKQPFVFHLDRRKAQPLEEQLAHDLRIRILKGVIRPQEPFPDAATLASLNDIDKTFVVSALNQLVNTGYLKEEKGAYTLVDPSLQEGSLRKIKSLHEIILDAGFKPSFKRLHQSQVTSSHHPMLEHYYAPDERLLYTQKLYYADDRPAFLLEFYVSLDAYPIDPIVLDTEHLHPHLKARYGVFPNKKTRRVRAKNAPDYVEKALALLGSEVLLAIENAFYDGERLIDVAQIWTSPNYRVMLD